MRKIITLLTFLFITLLFTGCFSSKASNGSASDPGKGLQVATVSSKPGMATAGPVQAIPLETQDLGPFILMQDDFSDSGSGWESYSSEYGRADYDQGGYLVEALIEKEYNLGVAGVDYADIRIEVDAVVQRTAANQNDAYGVDCRIQSNGDGYGFRISSDGYAGIVLFKDQEEVGLQDWIEVEDIFTDGTSNHLTAICEGNHFTLLVNDVFVAEVTDDTFASGDIALSAVSYEAEPISVLFDDIIVQEIGDPYLYEDAEPYPLQIVNNSEREVCWVYVSSEDAEYWGDAWVTSENPLAAGEEITIDGNTSRVVDVKVETCDSLRLLEEYRIDLGIYNVITVEEPTLIKRFEYKTFEGWTDGDVDGGNMAITMEDYYSLTAQNTGEPVIGSVDFRAADAVLRTDASLAQAGNSQEAIYGLMCRIQLDGSGIFFAVRGDGYGSIQKWRAGTLTPLTEWTYASRINQGIDANYIEADCIGDDYVLFVNGEYVIDAVDSDYKNGKVGLGVIPSSGSATRVDFDFFEIFEP